MTTLGQYIIAIAQIILFFAILGMAKTLNKIATELKGTRRRLGSRVLDETRSTGDRLLVWTEE